MAEEFGVQEGVFDKRCPVTHRVIPGKEPNVFVDSGHDNRTVFKQCSLYGWFATRGSDDKEIFHTKRAKGGGVIQYPMPYSQPERQSGIVGTKQPKKLHADLRGPLPTGWAFCIVMANPTLYGYLYALQKGQTGRTFGIADDFPEEYTSIYQAFIPFIDYAKGTNIGRQKWRKIRAVEHPWDFARFRRCSARFARAISQWRILRRRRKLRN